eukprot:345410-Prorocentrum_minimum.AAC.4
MNRSSPLATSSSSPVRSSESAVCELRRDARAEAAAAPAARRRASGADPAPPAPPPGGQSRAYPATNRQGRRESGEGKEGIYRSSSADAGESWNRDDKAKNTRGIFKECCT